MASFFPLADAAFLAWLEVFVAYCAANQVALGLTVQHVADLTAAHTAFVTAWSAYQVAHNEAEGATAAKNAARAAVEVIVRMLNTIIHANPDVTNQMLEEAGLTVRDTTPTVLDPSVVENTNPPQLFLVAERGMTIVHFGPTPENERANKKPEGMQGAFIYYAVGGIPGVDAEAGPWQLVAMDTNSPYNHVDAATENVTLAYKAQWVDRLGRLGRFCDPVTVAYTAQ